MRRLQGSAGQTTVEWLAVMVALIALASGLVAALPSTAGAITGAFQTMICKVSGASCPAPTAPRNDGLDPSAPVKGPAINGPHPPLPIGGGLPFPGSRSITIDPSKKGSTNDDPEFTGPKAGYSVGVTAKFERSTSPCSIDGTGTPSVTLATSADIKVNGGVNGGAKGVSAGVTGSLGTSTSYNIKTDPGTADRIENGDVPPPNPADPRSIPQGSSIVLNRDTYRGVDGSLAYHNITAELGYKDGHRVSAGVQRIDANTVRVTVGDTDFVENTLGLKVGTDKVNAGVSVGNGFQDGKARSVDIDVSTPEGWRAYQSFISTGRMPAQGAAGTSNPTTSTSDTSTHTDTIGGRLGPLGGTAGGTTVTGQIVQTKHPDGSSETTAFSRRGDTVAATEYDRDANGNIVNEHYALQLQNVDRHSIDGYQQLTGQHGDTSSNRDVSLTYSAADLTNIQNAAMDQILAAQRGMDGSPFKDGGTREQLRAFLADHPSGDGLAPYGTPVGRTILTNMASAKEPSDVLVALMNSGLGSGTGVMEFLENFYLETLRARHELGSNDTSPPLPGGYQNRPKGC